MLEKNFHLMTDLNFFAVQVNANLPPAYSTRLDEQKHFVNIINLIALDELLVIRIRRGCSDRRRGYDWSSRHRQYIKSHYKMANKGLAC